MEKVPKFKDNILFLGFLFLIVFTFWTGFQILYFKKYLEKSLISKAENSLNLIENKLSDYVKFLETYYKIPFIPEFAELPESKGWLLELIEFLEALFKREKFLNLAIYYQNKPLLSWDTEEAEFKTPSKLAKAQFQCKEEFILKRDTLTACKLVKIEKYPYLIYLALDISYYRKTFLKYVTIVILVYLLNSILIGYFMLKLIRAERKKEEIQKKLNAEKELALLGRMSATIAHEIRNTLNTLALLLQTQPGQEETKKYITQTMGEIQKLSHHFQEILIFTKDLKINLEKFSIEDFLLELRLFFSSLNTKGELILEIQNSLKELYGDRFWLKKAVENLLKNAISASPPQGKVILKLYETKDRFFIEVGDEGEVISPSEKEKIFEAFYTTKKEGLGIGLYLIKKIIEAHKGEVTVENLEPKGKVFILSWKKG
ncbi:MAG: HAMP domain-containing histidine kinase [Thermodesulfobacteriaceae bacterium]|nr:HAMP domain-containing histidine kinase [Thermodesulfobacteriaceae bacterium]MCX8041266.1 HAMP domain-containing histidine kinase [Thermodesulfobacteriaceae bacterium]MDW8136654.1 HAMP domain-containing sensor histidine kinase [Thermodesulfobacterium sp.]